MVIEYYTKSVYGNELIYLFDESGSGEGPDFHWLHMTGKKTITRSEMQHLTQLTGVIFERVFEPVEAPV